MHIFQRRKVLSLYIKATVEQQEAFRIFNVIVFRARWICAIFRNVFSNSLRSIALHHKSLFTGGPYPETRLQQKYN